MHNADGEATNLSALRCCKPLILQLHGALKAKFTIKTYIQLSLVRKTLNTDRKPASIRAAQ